MTLPHSDCGHVWWQMYTETTKKCRHPFHIVNHAICIAEFNQNFHFSTYLLFIIIKSLNSKCQCAQFRIDWNETWNGKMDCGICSMIIFQWRLNMYKTYNWQSFEMRINIKKENKAASLQMENSWHTTHQCGGFNENDLCCLILFTTQIGEFHSTHSFHQRHERCRCKHNTDFCHFHFGAYWCEWW